MLSYVHGEMVESTMSLAEEQIPAQAKAAPAEGLEFPYDVQFIMMGNQLNVQEVRNAIDAMGDSTLVVGDESTIKVHVHVKDPGIPISYGVDNGKITDVVVENMQIQMEDIIGYPTRPIEDPPDSLLEFEPDHIGVVAVAAGNGLAKIFQSLGAVGIVNGGQSNNPSTEEILQIVKGRPNR